jgi:hypothetical protein
MTPPVHRYVRLGHGDCCSRQRRLGGIAHSQGCPTWVDRHGIYRDARQATGFVWYCPREDWRYPSLQADESMWVYCPGCGLKTTALAMDLRDGGAP